MKEINRAYSLIEQGNDIFRHVWLTETFLSWQWFAILGFATVPWIIWYFCREKGHTQAYFVSAIFLILVSSVFDEIGLSLDLWRYPVKAIPIMSGLVPWNISLLPVCFLITIRYKPNWSPLLKAGLVSAGFTFIGEPFVDYLGLTNHLNWKHIYSFPIYFLIYLAAYKIYLLYSTKKNIQ